MKKVVSVILSGVLALTLLVSCSPAKKNSAGGDTASAESTSSVQTSSGAEPLLDREGNEIKLPEKMERIICTAPSNTEILVGLGLGGKLVAADTYSADVEGLPSGITMLDFASPDAEAIIQLKPDIIIAAGINKAVEGSDPFEQMEKAGICVVYVPSSDSVQGICDDITYLSRITGTEETGKKLVDEYSAEVEKIREIGKTITEKKKVYFEISPAPDLYSFGKGTFLNEFIELMGAENIFGDQEGWVAPSAEAVLKANPDVILTNVNYIDNPIDEIKSREGWDTVSAVKNGAVYPVPTNASSRPTQLSIQALKAMAKAVYPEYYE